MYVQYVCPVQSLAGRVFRAGIRGGDMIKIFVYFLLFLKTLKISLFFYF